MKFLHTSDWHLGMSFKGINTENDQRYFIDQICNVIRNEHIDAVLHAGDMFDRKNAPVEAFTLYDEAMTKIRQAGAEIIVVAGNHDSPERLSACSSLLDRVGMHISGFLTEDIKCIEYDDAQVFMLPWFTTEHVCALYPADADSITDMQKAYEYVVKKIRDRFATGKKHILLSHAYIVGAETSESDRAAVIGSAAAVTSDIFDGFDYVALGHIHKPQDISERIRYCGTPMMYSFSEESQEKSVTIIDTSDMSHSIVPLKLLHERITVSGKYSEIISGTYDARYKNAYVRVELTDAFPSLEIESALRVIFPELLEISGIAFDNSASITMTVQELEKAQDDPMEILKSFYEDTTKEQLGDGHIKDMFKRAVEKYGKEAD